VVPIRWFHRIGVEMARRSYVRQLEAALELRTRPMLELAERLQPA
jgi:hypothetical protein